MIPTYASATMLKIAPAKTRGFWIACLVPEMACWGLQHRHNLWSSMKRTACVRQGLGIAGMVDFFTPTRGLALEVARDVMGIREHSAQFLNAGKYTLSWRPTSSGSMPS